MRQAKIDEKESNLQRDFFNAIKTNYEEITE